MTNNILDRHIDRHMSRTERRALVIGAVTPGRAAVYATLLSGNGLILLAGRVNSLTALVGLAGFVAYTILYSLAKRQTSHGTLVGTIAGATPPVAGYTAVTGRLDAGALLLFLILVCWQMPHFYAIALYRRQEYQRAGLPLLPIMKGVARTKREIAVYICGFLLVCGLLSAAGYASYVLAAVLGLYSLLWLKKGFYDLRGVSDAAWGKTMFLYSLVGLPLLALMAALNPWLP